MSRVKGGAHILENDGTSKKVNEMKWFRSGCHLLSGTALGCVNISTDS